MEIISPGTTGRDREEKQKPCACFGARKLWTGDPTARGIEAATLAGGELFTVQVYLQEIPWQGSSCRDSPIT